MARIRTDNVFGTLTNNPLTNVATTMNAAGLANLATVVAPDVAVITLDPNRVNGAPEIVYVTAHTGSATSATILRGQEGTAARQHPSGTFWVHALTAREAHLGQRGFASRTTSATTSATTELTLLTASATSTGDRRWRVTYSVSDVTHTVDGDVFKVRIRQDGVVVGVMTIRSPAQGVGQRSYATVYTPSAGTKSMTATIQRVSGTGTMTMVAATGGEDSYLLVEDIGPA